jgi:diguanylate cyclase (GGDEF)-like protein
VHLHVRNRSTVSADPLSSVPDAVFHLDHSWRITYVNAAVEGLVRRRAERMLGRNLFQAFPATRGSLLEDQVRAVAADGRPRVFDYLYAPADRWLEIRAFPDAHGLVVLFRDVDDLHRARSEQAAEIRRLTSVLDALPSPTVLLDPAGRIVTVNRVWAANAGRIRSAGARPGQIGDDYLELMAQHLSPRDRELVADGLRALTAPGAGPAGTFTLDYSQPLGDDVVWYHLQAARVEDSGQLVITHTEITGRVRDQEALAWQATHDDLTGLPNRARLLELIDDALADGGRASLLFLDLDGFKTVNDSLGHELGDELLRQVGRRLAEQVRPGDAVGRLGGDQFLVLARSCDSSEAAALAFRLQNSFTRPFMADSISVPLSASIGVAAAQPGGQAAHQLLSDADAAAYAAKGAGRDRIHLFSPGLREAARWRLEVANRLRDGGAVDQLVVHYQPVVRLDTGEVEGVEALLRWQHPERGLLSPDAFLGVAEETGQLIPITRWLLGETTRQAAAWAAQGLPLRMAVNISARHFSAETLVRDVRLALHDSGLAPENLMLELTETSVAEDPARAEDQLSVLRGFGVRVAIDDFGTGWSSLAQLLALPIGTLKIDRSLLSAAARLATGGTGEVLAAIVSLARTLGIRSVAEGVETVEQLEMVRKAGCDLAQGYLLAHPMTARDVTRWALQVRAQGGDSCALAVQGRAS